MKIGMFTDSYKPLINGVTTSIETFKLELESRGHQVYIFAPYYEGTREEKNVFRLPAIDELYQDYPLAVPVLPVINKTIKPLGLDVIHIHTPFLAGNLGHRTAKKLKLPEIHTYHTLLTEYSHYVPSSLLQPLVKFGLKKLSQTICNSSDIVIAPSKEMQDLLISYSVKTPIIINPTGINLKNFRQLNKEEKNNLFEKYRIPLDKKIILFAGRLAQEKNLNFLLKCYEKVLKEVPKSHLVFAGGGPFEPELRISVSKSKFKKSITTTGYLSKEEIAKFFGSADVFAFPSITETQGIVILEAMASGCPVVAMDIFGPRDIIDHQIDGFLSKNNIASFSNHLISVLKDNKLREKLSMNSLEKVKKFSIEKCTSNLIAIYRVAIEANKNETSFSTTENFMHLLRNFLS